MLQIPTLDRTARFAVLLTPLLLLHAHGFAEFAIGVTCLSFLARSIVSRDWAWTRTGWLVIGWAWWAWQIICSLPIPALGLGEGGASSLFQALAFGRFLIFVAALEHMVLRLPTTRRWLYWIVAASAAYIAIQVIFQFLTGYNFYGWPIGPDGVLTGPFGTPRAGPPFAHIILPAILPWATAKSTRPGLGPLVQGVLILIGGVSVVLLTGQRMPFMLVCLGLVVVGLLLPRLRWGVVAVGLAVVVLLATSSVLAPRAYYRQVSKFSDQLEHFSASHYGKLYARALEIGIQNPITGLGAEGYRTGCPEPRYFRPAFGGGDGGGATICWDHPHNYYLEALVVSGFPGLFLFSALALAWLVALGRRRPDPLRAALFASTLITVWPITSTTSFVSMPVGGWCFLMLGWGLAEARWATEQDVSSSLSDPGFQSA